MNIQRWAMLLSVLYFCAGCAVMPTPIPAPTPTLTPMATVTVLPPTALLPTPVGQAVAPTGVPACKDAQSLDQPLKFSWAGMEDVVQNTPESNWTYYRCGDSQTTSSAFYRQWMPKPPFNWIEIYWEERADATMAVYFSSSGASTVPNRWLYLWFLPGKSGEQISYLVVAWWNVRPYC